MILDIDQVLMISPRPLQVNHVTAFKLIIR